MKEKRGIKGQSGHANLEYQIPAAGAVEVSTRERPSSRLGHLASQRFQRETLLGGLVHDPWVTATILLTGGLLVVALFPDVFAPRSPVEMHMEHRLTAPSTQFPLGTDEFGRDILSRIIHGTTAAMFVAFGSMLIAVVVGVPIGLLAGWYGGLLDSVLMRLQDALLAFPGILFAILAVSVFGSSISTITLVMAVGYVPRFARLMRANVLALMGVEFVTASRAMGCRDARIMFRTILPNAVPTLLVQLSLGLAFAILLEAGLSYLGLGVQPPHATWGSMLLTAQRYTYQSPWYAFFPGAAIFFAVLLFNFLGDRLRDNLDPRLKRFRDV